MIRLLFEPNWNPHDANWDPHQDLVLNFFGHIDTADTYHLRYFTDSFSNSEVLLLIAEIVEQWRSHIENSKPGDVLYLPYGAEDEGTACIRCIIGDDEATLTLGASVRPGYKLEPEEVAYFIENNLSFREVPETEHSISRTDLLNILSENLDRLHSKTPSMDQITSFLVDRAGISLELIEPQSQLERDLDVTQERLPELLQMFAQQFSIDAPGWRWNFYRPSEPWRLQGIWYFIASPPPEKHIPITPEFLLFAAKLGQWPRKKGYHDEISERENKRGFFWLFLGILALAMVCYLMSN